MYIHTYIRTYMHVVVNGQLLNQPHTFRQTDNFVYFSHSLGRCQQYFYFIYFVNFVVVVFIHISLLIELHFDIQAYLECSAQPYIYIFVCMYSYIRNFSFYDLYRFMSKCMCVCVRIFGTQFELKIIAEELAHKFVRR